ncbi:hypothetical protein ABN763_16395 [Spongiivirga sp. MCCC 1A20706]|uniref:hypothetical protein n=1 Tax=Spongiivirga sp. MCCC 1A20706 TaxID=3160963 RepID=UPI0039776B40
MRSKQLRKENSSNVKRYLVLLLIAITFSCSSQKVANYSFFKLLVTNHENEIMLVEWDGAWEIPGKKYSGERTVKEFVSAMALKHGIRVDNIKLNALITFHYDNRPNPTLMQYYTATLTDGNLKVPASCSDIRWIGSNESFKLIPYPEMVQIMKKVISKPNVLWGGAFDITRKTTNSPRNSKVKEALHILN